MMMVNDGYEDDNSDGIRIMRMRMAVVATYLC
jgi:hypothetical protein